MDLVLCYSLISVSHSAGEAICSFVHLQKQCISSPTHSLSFESVFFLMRRSNDVDKMGPCWTLFWKYDRARGAPLCISLQAVCGSVTHFSNFRAFANLCIPFLDFLQRALFTRCRMEWGMAGVQTQCNHGGE